MGWIIANTNEAYDGETHELAGRTFTGKTRTSESRRLEWVDLVVKSKAAPKKKRARNKNGTLKADDPSTPDVNEAYEQ
tara:strand:- start:150 stop:383 length:234 start_codon:yes stop_codon:yes gene_type:complete